MKPHTRRSSKALRAFEIPCTVTRTALVTVQAADADEALQKFAAGDWIGEEGTELVNWTATGPPRDTL